jgi:hypothetical protein
MLWLSRRSMRLIQGDGSRMFCRAPSHACHSRWLCMRPDHFGAGFVPIWGCGEHTKAFIMAGSYRSHWEIPASRCRGQRTRNPKGPAHIARHVRQPGSPSRLGVLFLANSAVNNTSIGASSLLFRWEEAHYEPPDNPSVGLAVGCVASLRRWMSPAGGGSIRLRL